jgi:hypothetical protein
VSVIDQAVRGFENFMDKGPPLPVTLALIFLTAPLLSLLHELGHAGAALVLLPGRVVIRVGSSKPMLVHDAGRLTVGYHPVMAPWRFDAVCTYEAPSSRVETALIALAGPAASLVTGIVAASVFVRVEPGLLHDLFGVTMAASFFTVLICLVPMTLTDSTGAKLRTDGATVLAVLR